MRRNGTLALQGGEHVSVRHAENVAVALGMVALAWIVWTWASGDLADADHLAHSWQAPLIGLFGGMWAWALHKADQAKDESNE